MELSIDTSTRYAGVALSSDGEVASELAWRSAQNHSVEVAPAIRLVMERAGVRMDGLEAIFVAVGPGGFSALRVGLSTAKAMAMALGVPLVGIGTLDIEAFPYLRLGLPVCAIIEAGRQRLYVGSYAGPEAHGRGPEHRVATLDELAAEIARPTLFCGEASLAVAPRLREQLGSRAVVAAVPPPTRRMAAMALMGWRRLGEGQTNPPETLQPMYLRSAQIGAALRRWPDSEPRRG